MSEPLARTCSEDCLAGGEPLAGTASDARFFAAISWPKALWHHDKVAHSEGLPESLRALEKSARAAGPAFFAIRSDPVRPVLPAIARHARTPVPAASGCVT